MERTLLDRAILAAYREAGITADPRTHRRRAPLLADLRRHLAAQESSEAVLLADQLTPYTTGTHCRLFAAPTTTPPGGHLTVYSLRDLPDELAPTAVLLALDRIWHTVIRRDDGDVRRLVVVDEAWTLMRESEGARFMYRMAKSARKHRAGLAVVTQDTADLLATDLGRAVVANAATQILLRQAPHAVDTLADVFHLSAGEADFLLTATRGEALLCAGPGRRTAFTAVASQDEHDLAVTGIQIPEG